MKRPTASQRAKAAKPGNKNIIRKIISSQGKRGSDKP